ncbi:prolyl-tRNA synthetase associated domain-containing protein [Ancylobacter mangrovi]|uniref:Prolyl-tRNA synthetase associated domain-containing protein n=1 Tax=Ancylobacter mangrovi TaxID=2972472 RepID=A0A9X2PFG2_9HYPH|nr:prolyl-tRNA synthetase associated domain-containing protein [Ancylobacter mangrovi]MCS0495213.1 prolyl-tRNA synthetase associated domain-containing protein [Ancylobacter mangrovi]MCS0502608.1 prolyl-tRNA synthetase associated domain-containing protein [Ancylobacter mangrovi]
MPLSPDDLFARLADLGIATTTIEHPPLFTVEDSQKLRGDIPGGHTKNLFLKDKKGNLFLVVVDEEARVDLKSLHAPLGAASRLSFGSAELLEEVLGVKPGAVTAFGPVNDAAGRVTVVLDAVLLEHEVINCHPLVNTATTAIGRDDLVRFLRATGHEPVIMDVPRRADAPDEA